MALVIQDISGLGMRVPVILGMPTIHRLCHQMKESEIESAPDEWQHALCSYKAAQGIFLQALMPGTDNEDGIKYPTNTGRTDEDGERLKLLTMEEHQKLLMEVLDKNGSLGKLEGWSAKNTLKAKCLLMEFHHVFCLEEGEMGVTDTAEYIIELLPGQDEPFKERFCLIAPHDVQEV